MYENQNQDQDQDQEERINIYTIILRIGSIEAGPPLSTILGNHGINTVNFVKELNDFLSNCPNYFFIRIKITVFTTNVSRYIFEVFEPSLFQCLKVVSYKKVFKELVKGKNIDVTYNVINLKDIYSICYIKYGYVDEVMLKSVASSIKSSNLVIFDEFS